MLATRDPAVRFFLRFAEAEGGLVEDAGDRAVVLLTADLQRTLDVSEELTVTADPDTAREEGDVLLAQGHPLLSGAVSRVLERGDAGSAFLAWPRSAPSPEILLARARERFPVAHGRLDPAAEPAPIFTPILRVGALLTYTVSLDDRFQEREEVWLDARTGLMLEDRARDALRERELLPATDAQQPSLLPDLVPAMCAAHAVLERRATARLATFADEAREELHAELARAEAYYDAALSSLERRCAAAEPDRRPLLEARSEATRAERARRLAEIEEKCRATYEIRPFRLHLLFVPALLVPTQIRRGERTYPLRLTWLLRASAFGPIRCSHCGESAALIAGRDRLGCTACLPRANGSPLPIPSRLPATSPPPSPPPSPATEGKPRPTGRTSSARKKPRTPVSQVSMIDAAQARRIAKEGGKLATRLWEAVASGERWPNKAMAPDSPARALYRLYGVFGPAAGTGIGLDQIPLRLSVVTADPSPGLPEVTTGALFTSAGVYPFSLRWRLDAGRAVLLEVLPFPEVVDDSFPPEHTLVPPAAARLFRDVPRPMLPLDAVGAELWSRYLPAVGLPLIVRCLAVWWTIEEPPDVPESVLAAALVGTLGSQARWHRARTAVGECRGLDPDALARASAGLRSLLEIPRGRSR